MSEPGLDNQLIPPPAADAAVPHDQAAGLVPLTAEVRARLDARAAAFADELVAADPRSPEFARRVESISKMGDTDLRASASMSHRVLQRRVAAGPGERTPAGAGDAGARVTALLGELRRAVAELDPAALDATAARGIRRLLGGGDPTDRYFARYRSAQDRLDAIITALVAGQDELRRDNAAIETEQAQARATLAKLSEYAALAAALDAEVTTRTAQLAARGRRDAADALDAEALGAIRRRHQDVLTHLAVSAQGQLALDVVRRSNLALIKAVEQARTATIRTLETAVAAARAVAGQHLVLDRIAALDSAAAAGLAEPGGLDALRRAFAELIAAMDAVDDHRAEAVANMSATIEALEGETRRAPHRGVTGP